MANKQPRTEHSPHDSKPAGPRLGPVLSWRLYPLGLAVLGVFAGSAKATRARINADCGSPSGRAFAELVLTEKLGIHHPDQVIDFDYNTDTSPFYVTEADGTVIHYQPLSGGKLALRLRDGSGANDLAGFGLCLAPRRVSPPMRPI